MENKIKKLEALWDEVLKMREENGECRDSPQKQEAIRLMHQWAHWSEEGKRYFQRKRAEIRLRLAEIEYREGKYISALLQIAKGLHLCKEIADEDLIAKLKAMESKIKENQGVSVIC